MDTATTVAVFSFAGVALSAVVGGIVAIYTNRAEKKVTAEKAAESAIEKTLRERITLRDEQIIDLKGDLDEANERLDKEILANRLLRDQLERLERERD